MRAETAWEDTTDIVNIRENTGTYDIDKSRITLPRCLKWRQEIRYKGCKCLRSEVKKTDRPTTVDHRTIGLRGPRRTEVRAYKLSQRDDRR